MKRLFCGILVGMICFSLGFTPKMPAPLEGTYNVNVKTLTLFDLYSKDIPLGNLVAEITGSKPGYVKTVVDTGKMTDPTYGSFKLGNDEKKVWFLMGKDEQGYWSDIYIDQNSDNCIELNEKLKSLQTYTKKDRKGTTKSAYTMIPFPLRISYKGLRYEYQKKLYFFLSADSYSNKSDSLSVVTVSCASFLEGEMKTASGTGPKITKFRIYDINGNGCFNDYGEDMLYRDVNYDGFFKKNEGQKLTEFFDVTGPGKKVQQYRCIVLPMPAKIIIGDAFKEYDRASLEADPDPESHDGETSKNDNTDKKDVK